MARKRKAQALSPRSVSLWDSVPAFSAVPLGLRRSRDFYFLL
ncbi:hypothetical protein [Scytonema sp. PCC 10023]